MQNFSSKPGENAAEAAANENVIKNPAGNFSVMPDEKLFELCRTYGERARLWRQKFAGLLPEVFKRELYKKKGFGSIFEFAAKLAGMSEEQVRRVLNLEKKFVAMPILKDLLISGEVSPNKLAKIASIATPESQEALADQVKLLSCRALETLSRDVHVNTNLQQNSQNAMFETRELGLSPEVTQKLFELKDKGLDINALLLELLEKRELEIAQKKEKLSAEAQPTNSPYLRVEVRAVMKEEYGEKCSIKTCAKPAEHIHHSQRYALSKIHDPKYLAPLCKEHHQIAHSIDLKYHAARASKIPSWELPNPTMG